MENENPVKRFDIKTEAKLLRALGKLLGQTSEPMAEENAIKGDIGVMDPANICMVVAKSEEARRILSRFKYFEDTTKIPALDYLAEKNTGHNKYSTEYLSTILKIFDAFEMAVTIKVADDFPASISNEHFLVILAPRVESN